MTVKADSKGRLTGAEPEVNYHRNVLPGGTIVYTPSGPKSMDEIQNPAVQEVRDVSEEEAEKFFGVPMTGLAAQPIEIYSGVAAKGFVNHGLVFQRFDLDSSGDQVVEDGIRKKTSVLIRIKEAQP